MHGAKIRRPTPREISSDTSPHCLEQDFRSVWFVAPSGAVVAMTEVFMAIVQVPVGFLPRPRKVVDPLGRRRGASGAGAR